MQRSGEVTMSSCLSCTARAGRDEQRWLYLRHTISEIVQSVRKRQEDLMQSLKSVMPPFHLLSGECLEKDVAKVQEQFARQCREDMHRYERELDIRRILKKGAWQSREGPYNADTPIADLHDNVSLHAWLAIEELYGLLERGIGAIRTEAMCPSKENTSQKCRREDQPEGSRREPRPQGVSYEGPQYDWLYTHRMHTIANGIKARMSTKSRVHYRRLYCVQRSLEPVSRGTTRAEARSGSAVAGSRQPSPVCEAIHWHIGEG